MKRGKKKLVPVLLATTMMGSLAVACTSKAPDAAPDNKTPDTSNTPAAATTYPMKSDKTLTYWGELAGNLTGVTSSHAETPFFQEWQKRTGVSMKFTAPPTGQAKQTLNVLLASGDLPDMIEFNFKDDFPGGTGEGYQGRLYFEAERCHRQVCSEPEEVFERASGRRQNGQNR
ncbi:hypothetical protein ACHHV8_27230 [Paenibacillus sp. TAB 01]|uniref:hypothetical protein n=1 Tax=Paenibacillus sp. TAB 01 TaxID=3368988 RepID=UPI0037539A28